MQLEIMVRFTREEAMQLATAFQPFHQLFSDDEQVAIGDLGPKSAIEVWKLVQLLRQGALHSSPPLGGNRLKQLLAILDALRAVLATQADVIPDPDWNEQAPAAHVDGKVPFVADPINMTITMTDIRKRQIRAIDEARPILTGALQHVHALEQIASIVATSTIAHAA